MSASVHNYNMSVFACNMVKIKHDKELEVEFFKEDFIADAKKWTKKNNDFID